MDVGALSGMKLDKAFADYPVFAEKWQNSPQNCIFPEGETTAEVYDRAKKALARVKADCMGKTAVITSHGFLLVRLSDKSHLPKELLGDPNQYVVHK